MNRTLRRAVVGLVVLSILALAPGVVGVLLGLLLAVLLFAACGYAAFLALRLFSPTTADKLLAVLAASRRPAA